jgi:hypothetical protein
MEIFHNEKNCNNSFTYYSSTNFRLRSKIYPYQFSMASFLNLRTIILSLILCLLFCNASGQTLHKGDSCHVFYDTSQNLQQDSCFETISGDIKDLYQKVASQDSLIQAQKDKEILHKKRKKIVVVSSLIVLQVVFGFDPKFTLINLIWLGL